LYGSLYHYPAADHPAGTMHQVYDWDTGKHLGAIPEVAHTYNVVGNMNEFGLSIGETTYGGVEALQEQDGAIIDYGSLIWITLQRAKTAREAIQVAGDLMATYGYASEGESFSIIDNNEAWVMELIGKGNYEKGAVWVAQKLPQGAVSAHANQARITTFPQDSPEECLYSKDVVSFAKDIGLYPKDASDADFSFSDVYDAVTFSGARFCDARVWSFFGDIMGQEWADQYLDYAMGANLTNRMPLWVSPPAKVSATDVMGHMRNHYENTKLSMDGTQFPDVGATFDAVPVRAHPLTWTDSKGDEYLNERPIATQQTGWNFVAQSRSWMPKELSGLLWFGVDDSATTVRFPVYGSVTRVPLAFAGKGAQDGVTPPMMEFDDERAFDVFNLMANWVYSRWDLM
jgi:dipeptidase